MCSLNVRTHRSIQALETGEAQVWALFVGVNHYQDQQLPSLQYSALDCQGLSAAFAEATCRFANRHLRIHHDFAVHPPSLSAVRDSLWEILAQAQPQDTVLVYFSGHGLVDTTSQQAYFCLKDTNKNLLATTGLAAAELMNLLGACAAKQQLLWLDACHSGGITMPTTLQPHPPAVHSSASGQFNPTAQLLELLRQPVQSSKRFYALLSCDETQQSWEFPELGHGVFTYYLMRGLRGEAADGQGLIDADRLYRYVYHQTLQYIDQTNQQLRLLNHQKQARGNTEFHAEYPLQTPKRIVEGSGEMIVGLAPRSIPRSRAPRLALIVDHRPASAIHLQQQLQQSGQFDIVGWHPNFTPKLTRSTLRKMLRTVLRSESYPLDGAITTGATLNGGIANGATANRTRDSASSNPPEKIQGDRHSTNLAADFSSHPVTSGQSVASLGGTTETAKASAIGAAACIPPTTTAFLYLHGHLEETGTGESWLVLGEGLRLSRAGLRRELRQAQVDQWILILDCPDSKEIASWVEDLVLPQSFQSPQQRTSPQGKLPQHKVQSQCILAVASPGHPTAFLDAASHTLAASTAHPFTASPQSVSPDLAPSAITAGLSITTWITQLQLQFREQPVHLYSWVSDQQNQLEIFPAQQHRLAAPENLAPLIGDRIPYVGLSAFDAADSAFFYGREQLTQTLVQQLRQQVAIAVIGASGSGKSSLVQAGLIAQLQQSQPMLTRDRWWIGVMRPGNQPLQALFQALHPLESSEQAIAPNLAALTPERFVEWIRRRPEPRVLWVVDQFEELFTLASPAQRQAFLDILLNAIDYAGDRFRLVFTLRTDFMAAALEVPRLAKILQHSSLLVSPHLSKEDYVNAIIRPAAQMGIQVETELVDQLLAELDQDASELPRLQFMLQQLWEQRSGQILTLQNYEALGGLRIALERTAQTVYHNLAPEAQACAQWIFLNLTQVGETTEDTRRRVTLPELVGPKYPAALVLSTVQALSAARLITVHGDLAQWQDTLTKDTLTISADRSPDRSSPSTSTESSHTENSYTATPHTEATHTETPLTHPSSGKITALPPAASPCPVLRPDRLELPSDQATTTALSAIQHPGEQQPVPPITNLNTPPDANPTANPDANLTVNPAVNPNTTLEANPIAILDVNPAAPPEANPIVTLEATSAVNPEANPITNPIANPNANSEANSEANPIANPTANPAPPPIANPTDPQPQLLLPAYSLEIIHESLIRHWSTLRWWLEDNRARLRSQRQIAEMALLWHQSNQAPELLLEGAWLTQAEQLYQDHPTELAAPVQAFILASLTHRQQQQHNQRLQLKQAHTAALAAGLCGAIATGYAGVAGWQQHQGQLHQIDSLMTAALAAREAHQDLESLTTSLQAGQQLQQLKSGWGVPFPPGVEREIKVVGVLQQALTHGREINRLEGHHQRLNTVTISPDGQLIATAGEDRVIKLWKPDGSLVKELTGHTSGVTRVVFSPDGQQIASASADFTIKLWKLDGTLVRSIPAHRAAVTAIAFNAAGNLLFSASRDQTLKVWRVLAPNRPVPHAKAPTAASAAPPAAKIPTLKSTSPRPENTSIAVPTETPLRTFVGHQGVIHSLDLHPSGKLLASAGSDGTVKLWRLDRPETTPWKSWRASPESVNQVLFSPNGKTIAIASSDTTVRTWNWTGQTWKFGTTLEGHTAQVLQLAFSPDGRRIASASRDRTVRVWAVNGSRSQLLHLFQGHTQSVNAVSFSPNGQVLATASSDKTARLWNLQTRERLGKGGYTSAFSPDGQVLAIAGADATPQLWRRQGNRYVHLSSLEGHDASIQALVFSPDGKTLASASSDADIKLWNWAEGKVLRTLGSHTDSVLTLAFSPDGQRLISGSADRTIKIWAPASGELLRSLEGHGDAVTSLSFSPYGRIFASGSLDRTVRLWKTDGTPLQTLGQHDGGVNAVQFSPNSQQLVSAGDDHTIKQWDLGTGHLIRTLADHDEAVTSLDIRPDGQVMVSASQDGSLKLWQLKDGQRLSSLTGDEATQELTPIRTVKFSPDGRQLLSATEAQGSMVWDLDLQSLLLQARDRLGDRIQQRPAKP